MIASVNDNVRKMAKNIFFRHFFIIFAVEIALKQINIDIINGTSI